MTFTVIKCFPLRGNLFLVFITETALADSTKLTFDCTYEADVTPVSDKPSVVFDSVRDLRPIHVNYNLPFGVKGVARIPWKSIVPFQPFGEYLSLFLAMIDDAVDLFSRVDNSRENTLKFINQTLTNLQTPALIIFTPAGQVEFQYFKTSAPYVKMARVMSRAKSHGTGFANNLITKRDLCYVLDCSRLPYPAYIVMEVDPAHTIMDGVSVFVQVFYTAYIYMKSLEKGDELAKFLETFQSSPNFSLVEFFHDRKITWSMPFNINPSMNDLTKVTDGKWIFTNRVVTTDPSTGNEITSMIGQDVTNLEERQHTIRGELDELEAVYNKLETRHFAIKDSVPILDDGTNLLDIVKADERPKIKLNHERAVIRLQNGECFGEVNDGQEGFIFSIQNLVKRYEQLSTNNSDMQLVTQSSMVTFWAVDVTTDSVMPLFNQPTIWDVLSFDSQTKFSIIATLIHPADADDFRSNWARVVSGETDSWVGEFRLLRINSKYEWYRFFVGSGQDSIVHCAIIPIIEEREVKAKLTQTKKLRDLLLSSGKLALWQFTDEDIERETSYTPGVDTTVVMNWHYIHTLPLELQGEFEERMNSALNFGEVFDMNLPMQINGHEQWFSLRGKLRGGVRQIVGVCIDISDLHEAYTAIEIEKKRAEMANRQKTVFLANMSHEIRTPMNGIYGNLDVFAMMDLTSEQRLLVDSLRSSSSHLMELLSDTLNLSKIEHGEIDTRPIIYDFGKLIESICIPAASRARLSKIDFIVNLSHDFPIMIYGDPQLFTQIINNIISNALKFTREGYIRVDITWKTSGDSEVLNLKVRDTGIGMSKEQQRIIFQRFIQADESVARRFGGTGLGLSLVQELVHFLNGTINLESESGKGTCFTIDIPSMSVYHMYSPPFSDGKRHFVQVFVDDELIRHFLIDAATSFHYEAIAISSPDEVSPQAEVVFVAGKQPVNGANICGIIEPGMTPLYEMNLTQPLLPFNVKRFLDNIRYNVHQAKVVGPQIAPPEKPHNVLIVEDNTANQFVMQKMMQKLKCQFKIANNGQEAIDLLEKEEFDVVFMDCQMPVLDGLAATRIIRASAKDFAKVPIVALTASAVEGDEESCLSAGMNAYISKPVRIQQISNVLNKL